MSPQDALSTLLDRFRPVGRIENVALGNALGRLIAADVCAQKTLRAFARATMDGYAVVTADTFGAWESAPAYLRQCGEVAMGSVPTIRLASLDV